MQPLEFLESGIIESYVLGMATREEILELQRMSASHSEVQQALTDYQHTMWLLATKEAQTPSSQVYDRLVNQLFPQADEVVIEDTLSANEKTVSKNRTISMWPQLAAAAIILWVGTALLFLYKQKEATQEISSLKSAQQHQADSIASLHNVLAGMTDANSKPIVLAGVPGHEHMHANVYWNSEKQEVFFAKGNLPATPTDKQYQLWAIVDGKPVDLGVFDEKSAMGSMQKMKSVANAQMFAITLEKAGGVPSPTMEQMMVAGKPS